MRPLYLDTDTEQAIIEALNEADGEWRELYDSPLDAAEELIPEFLEANLAEYSNDEGYRELDFND